MNATITRWKTGPSNLAQRWTEFLGRFMLPSETPWAAERRFTHWLETGESV